MDSLSTLGGGIHSWCGGFQNCTIVYCRRKGKNNEFSYCR
jgi:hypothetical protein